MEKNYEPIRAFSEAITFCIFTIVVFFLYGWLSDINIIWTNVITILFFYIASVLIFSIIVLVWQKVEI